MNKINNILRRIWKGLKIGIMLPVLPESVSKWHNHPLTRIFRVLGGISLLLVLSKSEFPKIYLFYTVFPLALLQFIYIIIVISLIKFVYIIYLWRNIRFQVRNSPLDRLASFSVTLVSCVKGTCVLVLSGGTALGMGLGIDELLTNYGRDPVFKDTLGKGLDKVLDGVGLKNPKKDISNIEEDLKRLKYRYGKLIGLNKDLEDLDSIGKEAGVNNS